MKVLVTGHNGYIGSVLTRVLQRAGHEVTGLDTYLFDECTFGPRPADIPALKIDVRDVEPEHLAGFDAVIHLAALCNDPLGNLNPACTEDINYRASVRLARLAKQVGVPRYLFASSCSLYGVAGSDQVLDENAPFHPITAYGETKVRVEQEVSKFADAHFSPTFLRNATAYGISPRLRGDVVVNNLVAVAYTTGEVMVQSDGTPWRPLVHIEDISNAFLAILQSPRALVHSQAFNVGSTRENYQVRELAQIVSEVVPGSRVTYAPGGGPDARCYRVNCDKIAATLPEFRPHWTVREGMEELFAAFKKYGLDREDFLGNRYQRIKTIQKLQREGRVDAQLRWTTAESQSTPEILQATGNPAVS
jgi:nucleoside-diphosphate-sugar epimerase